MRMQDDALMNRLRGLSGTAFDQAYIAAMVQDHAGDVPKFQQEATSGADPRVKAYAADNLGVIRAHLALARATASAIGANVSTVK